MPSEHQVCEHELSAITQSRKGEMIQQGLNRGQKAIDEAQAIARDAQVTCSASIVFDKVPARAILRARLNLSPDIVVMASHGDRGVRKFLLGSTASEVLTRIQGVPVMICRKPVPTGFMQEHGYEDDENETP
jgi:nucleotide-binding universal stress UspA family protein